jgi:PEP-CTERM motif
MPRSCLLRQMLPAATALTFACIAHANASTAPVNTLPFGLDYFSTSGPGPVNPGVLVGFNPQPDPPGDVGGRTMADLTNPGDPSFVQPGSGVFTILFGLTGPGGSPFSFILPGSGPMKLGNTGLYSFLATDGSSAFQVSFDISGFTGGWNGFNPQPDPPGDFANSFEGFSFFSAPVEVDPKLGVTLVEGTLDNGNFIPDAGAKSFALVPEPASLAVLGFSFAGLVAVRRRRAA